MRTIFFLLRRALWPERGSLSTYALWIAVLGVGLGIAQLMVVLAVMSGFQDMLSQQHIRISSQMVVVPSHEQKAEKGYVERLVGIAGVEAATPFLFGQAMLLHKGVGGVVLEGVDRESSQKVLPWNDIWEQAPQERRHPKLPWIWVGSQLAKKLELKTGDIVRALVVYGDRRKTFPFEVTAITKFGLYEHDLKYARIDLSVLKNIYGRKSSEPMYKLKVDSGKELEAVRNDLQKELGFDTEVRLWSEINENIFLAVQHQKAMLFLVLEILVALAAVNVVVLLIISVQNRKRDVAILRAMGMRFREVILFFLSKGAAIGAVGVVVGVVLGQIACELIVRFQPVPLAESIYNVTELPIRVRTIEVFWIGLIAFLVCVLFSVVPAIRAAITKPVDALRYE